MDKREPASIKSVLGDVGKRLGVESALQTGTLWRRWREIVGPEIADHAEPTSLKEGVLRVRADSAAWATEIGYLGPEIARRANAMASSNLVREVRVWNGPPPEIPLDLRVEKAPPPDIERAPKESPEEALEAAREAWQKRWSRGSENRRQNPSGTSEKGS